MTTLLLTVGLALTSAVAGAALPLAMLVTLRAADRAKFRALRRESARQVGAAEAAQARAEAAAAQARDQLAAERERHADRLASRDLEVDQLVRIVAAVRPAGRERLYGYPTDPQATQPLNLPDRAETEQFPAIRGGAA